MSPKRISGNRKTATIAAATALTLLVLLIGPAAGLAWTDVGSYRFGTMAAEPVTGPPDKFSTTTASTAGLADSTPREATPIPKPGPVASASSGSEQARAEAILAAHVARYPILQGTTVTMSSKLTAYQAIAYYKSASILVSTGHTASLERIIGHEVWHIIDYRDNGVIDWGENVPPSS